MKTAANILYHIELTIKGLKLRGIVASLPGLGNKNNRLSNNSTGLCYYNNPFNINNTTKRNVGWATMRFINCGLMPNIPGWELGFLIAVSTYTAVIGALSAAYPSADSCLNNGKSVSKNAAVESGTVLLKNAAKWSKHYYGEHKMSLFCCGFINL
jgi:hypothetical protein